MNDFYLPWLEAAIVLPLVGACLVARQRRAPDLARRYCLAFAGAALLCATVAWWDFVSLGADIANLRLEWMSRAFGWEYLALDELSAPLLPLSALLFFMTSLATLRTKVRRFSFGWALVSESIVLATLSTREPWTIIALLALATVLPYWELKARGKPTGVYVFHMALFIASLVVGQALVVLEGQLELHGMGAVTLLMVAVFIRSGIVPFHCWMTDLFEHATFGTALLFVTPITGAYAALRLVLPIAPPWLLTCFGVFSIVSALYAAGMTLVQRDARRFFCYLFLSHSALVFVGLDSSSSLGLAGALCVWLSAALALSGLGLTVRALESRHGRLSLVNFHGVYDQTPALAICFLLTGLASVGFPGTFGFIGTEMLVSGAVNAYPYVGVAVVVVAALNGIAVLRAYFQLFTGTRHASSVPLQIRFRERCAVLALAALILCGGIFPQRGVSSRYEAACEVLRVRGLPVETGEHE